MSHSSTCPRCGSADVFVDATASVGLCGACGHREGANGFRRGEELEPARLNLDVTELPCFLASALDTYARDDHPALRLWSICHTVETLLKFVVVLGLSESRSQGRLPPDLARAMVRHIEMPTLGRWRAMACSIAGAPGGASSLFPEIRTLVESAIVPLLDGAGEEVPTPACSLLRLRNRLAHGQPLTTKQAKILLRAWEDPFERALEHLDWMREIEILGRQQGGHWVSLRGCGAPDRAQVSDAMAECLGPDTATLSDEVVVVRRGERRTLWPLVQYGVPLEPDSSGESSEAAVPQIYMRRDALSLTYLPLGSDRAWLCCGTEQSLEGFLRLFRFDEEGRRRIEVGFEVEGFEVDIRRRARAMVGRQGELQRLHDLVVRADSGILWLHGPAGSGKSALMARLVRELLDEGGEDRVVLPFLFRENDSRCTRTAFLRFAVERLEAMTGSKKPPADLPLAVRLASLLRGRPRGQVLFLLDGLDEIARSDAGFVETVLLPLAHSPAVWLCAGRQDGALATQLTPEVCTYVYPDGLPPMSALDIRAMVLEKVDILRRHILRQDHEVAGEVVNPFIARVAQRADGLPIYVQLVIGDLLSGRLSAADRLDASRPPPSVEDYHEHLLRRHTIGDLQSVLTPIAILLAIAHEPLSPAQIADYLAHRELLDDAGSGQDLVSRGLRALAPLLRLDDAPDRATGYVLHHTSLRDHLLQGRQYRTGVRLARRSLAALAKAPPRGALRAYLFRTGVCHTREAHGTRQALELLTDFAWLYRRLETLGGQATAVHGVSADWAHHGRAPNRTPSQDAWVRFWRGTSHLLEMAREAWPAQRILVQRAMEHADAGSIREAAEEWLQREGSEVLWFRQAALPSRPAGLSAVLAGTGGGIRAVIPLDGDRLLSLPEMRTVKVDDQGQLTLNADHRPVVWDTVEGRAEHLLEGHSAPIEGGVALSDGSILTWSWDHTLRCWDARTGQSILELRGHRAVVRGALPLEDDGLVSWSQDGTIALWKKPSGARTASVEAHKGGVAAVRRLADGRFISWTFDALGEIRNMRQTVSARADLEAIFENSSVQGILRDLSSTIVAGMPGSGRDDDESDPPPAAGTTDESHRIAIWRADAAGGLVLDRDLVAHQDAILGVELLGGGWIASWDAAGSAFLWDAEADFAAHPLDARSRRIRGIRSAAGDTLVAWTAEGSLLLYTDRGDLLDDRQEHAAGIRGIVPLADDRVLSWAMDGKMILWHVQGGALDVDRVLEGHSSPVRGVIELEGAQVLSWADDEIGLLLWNTDSDEPPRQLRGHHDLPEGASQLSDGRIATWSADPDVRLWRPEALAPHCVDVERGHSEFVVGYGGCGAGRVVTWSRDGALVVWDLTTGLPVARMTGHRARVTDAVVLRDDRLLSWSIDGTIRVWDMESGDEIALMEGHTESVAGALEVEDHDEFLSWSRDGTVRTWDVQTGAAKIVIQVCEGGVTAARVWDSDKLLAAGADGRIHGFHRSSGEPWRAFDGHESKVLGLREVSGSRLVSWAVDRSIRLWDPPSGRCLAVLHPQLDSIADVVELSIGVLAAQDHHGRRFEFWDGETFEEPAVLSYRAFVDGFPDLFEEVFPTDSPAGRLLCGGFLASFDERFVVLTEPASHDVPVAMWFGDAPTTTPMLFEDGTIVTSMLDGQVVILGLHCGTQRITLTEARSLSTRS